MLAAADMSGTAATFVKTILEDLQDLNVITDFEECFDIGKYGRKNYRVDAYSFDDYDCSMSIFIADFDGESEVATLTMTEAKGLFEKLNTFLEGSLNGNFRHEMEISTPAYDLVERIVNLENTIRKFRFFVITDKTMSEKISAFSQGDINGIPIEYNIWDIQRLFSSDEYWRWT